ncbi:hypothetical protein Tco_1577161 [Tanacetum coccineum]
MSSLHNISPKIQHGDQILNDKPSEPIMRRQQADTEAESKVTESLFSKTLLSPLQSKLLVIDPRSRPHSPNIIIMASTTTTSQLHATTIQLVPLPYLNFNKGSIHRDEDEELLMKYKAQRKLRKVKSASGATGTTGASYSVQAPLLLLHHLHFNPHRQERYQSTAICSPKIPDDLYMMRTLADLQDRRGISITELTRTFVKVFSPPHPERDTSPIPNGKNATYFYQNQVDDAKHQYECQQASTTGVNPAM